MPGQDESRSEQGRSERRPYEAPRVARVDLKADEVLATGCKTQLGGTAVNASCFYPTCSVRGLS